MGDTPPRADEDVKKKHYSDTWSLLAADSAEDPDDSETDSCRGARTENEPAGSLKENEPAGSLAAQQTQRDILRAKAGKSTEQRRQRI